MWLLFSVVMSTRGVDFGSGLGTGANPINETICDFVMSGISCGIFYATLVMFSIIKEGVMELLDERLVDFRVEIAADQIGAQTLSQCIFGSSRLAEPQSSSGRRTALLVDRGLLTWRMINGLVPTLRDRR